MPGIHAALIAWHLHLYHLRSVSLPASQKTPGLPFHECMAVQRNQRLPIRCLFSLKTRQIRSWDPSSISMYKGTMEAVGDSMGQLCPGDLLKARGVQDEKEGLAVCASHNRQHNTVILLLQRSTLGDMNPHLNPAPQTTIRG